MASVVVRHPAFDATHSPPPIRCRPATGLGLAGRAGRSGIPAAAGPGRLGGDVALSVDLARSFERHLRAENKSDTVETYLEGVTQLAAFLEPRAKLADASREDTEAYLGDLLARWKPAIAAKPLPGAAGLLCLAEEEDEIPTDPMAKMRPPRVPEQLAAVLTVELLQRLLAVCGGRRFEVRRDRARTLLLDSGGPTFATLTSVERAWSTPISGAHGSISADSGEAKLAGADLQWAFLGLYRPSRATPARRARRLHDQVARGGGISRQRAKGPFQGGTEFS